MATRAYKQDLPPKGGYAKLDFARIPARRIVNGPILIGGFFVSQVFLWANYYKQKAKWQKLMVENKTMRVALQPMLLAERDRAFIKHLKQNRDAEEDLMKDVEGWEVGTYFGEPVFKTIPDGHLMHYMNQDGYDFSPELFVHNRPGHYKSCTYERQRYEMI